MSKDLVLYHGTSLEFYNKIIKEGLNNPCLTSSKELAYYYAEVADGDDDKVVLEVCIKDTTKLKIDFPSVYEPGGFGRINSKTLEDNVESMFNELKINNTTFTDYDYHISLDTVYTCKYDDVISPNNLKIAIQTP